MSVTDAQTKCCSKCSTTKPVSEFYHNRSSKDGRYHYCKPCSRKRNAERYAALPEAAAVTVVSKTCTRCSIEKPADAFSRHAKSKDGLQRQCRACDSRYNADNAESRRRAKLRKEYGITLEQYDGLLASQEGRCACCGASVSGGRRGVPDDIFFVDHDHQSGQIRGLLCRGCNLGIGSLGDTLEAVERAVRYLKKAAAASPGSPVTNFEEI